jgi:pilus assembly protein CpaB
MLLVLALGCGLVASIGITQVMAKKDSDAPKSQGETETIFVALTDIGQGDVLNSQVLKLEEWPKDKVPVGAMTKIEEVEGRRSRTKLYQGEPILENKLFSKGVSEQGATAMIPKGYRVVVVKVDPESGGSGMILPGDRVDVLVHLKADQKVLKHATTRTILQDIKVFAVNNVFKLDSQPEDDPTTKTMTAKTVSLLVTPKQAEKVMLASELGSIRLVMRSPEDDEVSTLEGSSQAELFGAGGASNREEEELLEKPAEPEQEKPDLSAFMDMFKAMQAGAGTAASGQPGSSTDVSEWTVRVLAGTDMNEVVLEPDPNDASRKMWKLADEVETGQPPLTPPSGFGSSSMPEPGGFAPPAPDPDALERLLGPSSDQKADPPETEPPADD